MARFDLTDDERAILEPLLPEQPVRGGQWRDHRQVINGICWVKRTGSPWRDAPERCGPWKTLAGRFRRWATDGTWAKLGSNPIRPSGYINTTDPAAPSTPLSRHTH